MLREVEYYGESWRDGNLFCKLSENKIICRTYRQETDPKFYRQNMKLKCCFFVLIATRCRKNRTASFGNGV
jgi:hypothetical protein